MENQPAIPESSTEKTVEKKENRLKRLAHYLSKERPMFFRFADTIPPEIEQSKVVEIKKDRFLNRFRDGLWRRLFHDNIVSTEFVATEGEAAEDEPKPEKRAQPRLDKEATSASDTELLTPETPAETAAEIPPAEPPEGPPPIILPPEDSSPSPAERTAAEHVMAPFRRVEGRTDPTRPVERVIERPRGATAVAALLGLEYLARRRADRKIRKAVSRDLSRQQKDTEYRFNRAEQQARSTKREVRDVKGQQQALESQLGAVEAKQSPAVPPEAIQPPPLAAENEKRPIIEKEKLPPAEQVAEQVVKQSESLKKPEAVLERMAVAAEQDIPVEAVYERRHETKKERPQESRAGAGGSGQVQVPTLLAQAMQERLQSTGALPVAAAQVASSPTQSQDLYRQAVKNGLWGAVAILIFIAIAFLLAHR